MRVSRVIAKNFRCLRDVDVKLRPFTVLVGSNGAGKSSLLGLLRFFGRAATPLGLSELLLGLGGFHAARSLDGHSDRMELGIMLDDLESATEWTFRIDVSGSASGAFFVSDEQFYVQSTTPASQAIASYGRTAKGIEFFANGRDSGADPPGVSSSEPVLSGMGAYVPEIARFTDALARVSLWRGYAFQPNERVRSPQQLRHTALPANDGSDLFSALYNLRTSRRPVYRELIELLRLAMPQFEDVEFPVVGVGYVYMSWRERGLELELTAGQLSDGTLRLLWLLTILLSAPGDGLVLIDEPELGLHPQWIQLLVGVLRKTSARTNVIVATQSAELVRWLEKDELLIADFTDEGGTKFSWANEHPDIDKWLKDFTLSELWTMGELGGRR